MSAGPRPAKCNRHDGHLCRNLCRDDSGVRDEEAKMPFFREILSELGGNRTHDQRIKSPMLYQLSYEL